MPPLPRAPKNLPAFHGRRAVVIGAGSFGTAVAVLLARGGMRTTLQARTPEQARRLVENRENREYLPGVELPRELRIEPVSNGVSRADYIFLAVPSARLDQAIESLADSGLSARAAIVSLAKGLMPPEGVPPTVLLSRRFGPERVACLGGPAHAAEMVREGAGLVAASTDEALAAGLAQVFMRAGIVCERSNDPVGVELAGAAKNAAALASGATEAQGLNAAGAAAGHIFAEVWRWAESQGARPESMIGLAGTGDLVATALAPESRNRRAGELLAQGLPASEIPARIGQAVEALESVPLLAKALRGAGFEAPVNSALAELIEGTLPLDDWVVVVRATVPPPARWRAPVRRGFWSRLRARFEAWRERRRLKRRDARHAPSASASASASGSGSGDAANGGDESGETAPTRTSAQRAVGTRNSAQRHAEDEAARTPGFEGAPGQLSGADGPGPQVGTSNATGDANAIPSASSEHPAPPS